MTDPAKSALTHALQESLKMGDQDAAATSPLAEAQPTSMDELFDRINNKLILGLPETITEDDLGPVVARLRAQRLRFMQEEQAKALREPRKRRATAGTPRSIKEALEVGTLDELEGL